MSYLPHRFTFSLSSALLSTRLHLDLTALHYSSLHTYAILFLKKKGKITEKQQKVTVSVDEEVFFFKSVNLNHPDATSTKLAFFINFLSFFSEDFLV